MVSSVVVRESYESCEPGLYSQSSVLTHNYHMMQIDKHSGSTLELSVQLSHQC